MGKLSKTIYKPSDGIKPTIVNMAGDLFLFNDRDDPQVLYRHDTTQTYNVGTQSPSGFQMTVVAGGDAENAEFSYLFRWRWQNSSNGYVSNPTSGISFETTSANRAVLVDVHPEPVYGSGKYDKVVLEMTRPGGAEFYVLGVSGMPTTNYSLWQFPVLGQTEGTLRSFDAFGHTPPPSGGGRVVHQFKGRLWSCDLVKETLGTCQIAAASTTVSGVSTAWGDWSVGRLFTMEGSGVTKAITAVVGATGLTLDSAYGTSYATGNYAIFPQDPHIVRYSQAINPESWNTAGNYERLMTNSNDRPLAFATYYDSLMIMGNRTTLIWTYDLEPKLGKIQEVSNTRGAINHECVVNVNNTIYCLDFQGVWRFRSTAVEHISRPIDEILSGARAGWGGINWSERTRFHAVHHEARKEIIWYVSLNRTGEGKTLQRAIVYRYEDDSWGIYEYINNVMCAALLPDDNNNQVPVVSTSGSTLWAFGTNTVDGPPSSSAVSGLVGAGSTTTQLNWNGDALYATNVGLQGCAVIVDGIGSGLVSSNLTSTITLQSPLPASPTVGNLIRIAPIETRIQSSQKTIAPDAHYTEGKYITIRYIPTASTYNLRVRFYMDYDNTAEIMDDSTSVRYQDIDMATSGGLLEVPIPKEAFRRMAVRIDNTEPRNSFQLTRITMEGIAARDEAIF